MSEYRMNKTTLETQLTKHENLATLKSMCHRLLKHKQNKQKSLKYAQIVKLFELDTMPSSDK